MKYLLSFLILIGLPIASSFAADWKSPADLAVQMPPGAVMSLENKTDKSEQDVYMLTVIYYREYQRAKMKKIFQAHEKTFPDGPVVKWLQSIILLGDHRHQECRDVLTGVNAITRIFIRRSLRWPTWITCKRILSGRTVRRFR